MHTHQTVHDIIQGRWESDEPDKILEVLRQMEGKMLTTRILVKMPGGRDRWRLRREYGMTHLETWEYTRTQGNGGISLLLDWREDSFPIETAKIEERNTAYFSARRARNHTRMEAMNTKPLLDQMAAAMNHMERAMQELQEARATFEALADYGQPFNPDQYELERACGWRDEKGERLRY